MTVQLEVGMTAMRRDGERVGPVLASNSAYSFHAGGVAYASNGKIWNSVADHPFDLIAAGYPWATLGAQVGDTVRCVWSGNDQSAADLVFILTHMITPHPDSLFVIVKTAAKPADRPRAAHKLDLQDGDVVELVRWQDGDDRQVGHVGEHFKVLQNWLWNDPPTRGLGINGSHPKGHRPLFRVISRAADAKQDEVYELFYVLDSNCMSTYRSPADTHRFTIAFPHGSDTGSDTGTVTREKL